MAPPTGPPDANGSTPVPGDGEPRLRRRTALVAVGSAILAGVSGCLSGPQEPEEPSTTTETEPTTATTTTEPRTETTTTTESPTETTTTRTTRQRPTKTTTVEGGVSVVNVEFLPDALQLSRDAVDRGRMRVEVNNRSRFAHHLYVVRTDLDPATLPRAGDNTVDETDLEVVWDKRLPNGTRDAATVGVGPGQYVFFCDEPYHYRYGEFATLTVE